jgi:hypothetical protein
LYLDPKEILPLAADPGSIGYYTTSFRINFYKKKRITNSEKKLNFQCFIIPYELTIPINGKNTSNNVLTYTRPSYDKGYIEGYFYLGFNFLLK